MTKEAAPIDQIRVDDVADVLAAEVSAHDARLTTFAATRGISISRRVSRAVR